MVHQHVTQLEAEFNLYDAEQILIRLIHFKSKGSNPNMILLIHWAGLIHWMSCLYILEFEINIHIENQFKSNSSSPACFRESPLPSKPYAPTTPHPHHPSPP